MAKHKKKTKVLKAAVAKPKSEVTLSTAPWDSPGSWDYGPQTERANELTVIEGRFQVDPKTGKKTNPNNVRGKRRVCWIELYHVKGYLTDRQLKDPTQLALRSMTVEHPYGTIKSWMGATHFKMRRLKNVATEMALHVLAYNMTRVMKIIGIPALIAAMRA